MEEKAERREESPEAPAHDQKHPRQGHARCAERLPNSRYTGKPRPITIKPADFLHEFNYLGKSQWPDPLFDGRLDEFLIFNKALDAAQDGEEGAPLGETGRERLPGGAGVAGAPDRGLAPWHEAAGNVAVQRQEVEGIRVARMDRCGMRRAGDNGVTISRMPARRVCWPSCANWSRRRMRQEKRPANWRTWRSG